MDGDLDLRDAFHQGFGPEPQHRPVSDRVEAGHRAVRRRRLVGAVLTVAVATVVGLGSVAMLGGGPSGTPQVATQGAPDPSPETPSALAYPNPHYDEDGTLVLDPESTVVDRVDNPLELQPPDTSVALAMRWHDETYWTIIRAEFDQSGVAESTGEFTTASADFADFRDWVDVQTENLGNPPVARGDDYIPKVPVRFDQGENLVPVDGIRIVLQEPHPDLPESFAPADARTAVALVEGRDGTRQWVLARDVEGFDVVKFPASKVGEDLEAFLQFARNQYAGGTGLR